MLHHLQEIDSTNDHAFRLLRQGAALEEGTTFYTTRQNCGRGQIGNHWESEPEKNIAFSVVLHPTMVAPRKSWVLSEVVAVATAQVLNRYVEGCSIKWPNDIYYGERKIAGILIENILSGATLKDCVIGVGINLNQTMWQSDAPNPVSVAQIWSEMGKEGWREPEEVMIQVREEILHLYATLKTGDYESINNLYWTMLYRRKGWHPYVDESSQERFMARIADIEPSGRLCLEDTSGQKRCYMFKEVKFATEIESC